MHWPIVILSGLYSQHVPLFAMKMIQSGTTWNRQPNQIGIPTDKYSETAITFTFAETFLLNEILECMTAFIAYTLSIFCIVSPDMENAKYWNNV